MNNNKQQKKRRREKGKNENERENNGIFRHDIVYKTGTIKKRKRRNLLFSFFF